MLVWDNQQATSWFVGILEGEASFYLRDTGYRCVSIPNNNLDIIEACENFLKANFVFFKRYEVKAGKKIGYVLHVTDVETIRLFNCIQDKLQCRRKNYEQILGASETECELTVDQAWLIGIFEAEGSFILSTNYRGNYTPKIELDNTNDLIISKIIKTLYNSGCSYYVKQYEPSLKLPYKKITIQGLSKCISFLRKFQNWQSKTNQKYADLITQFCQSRIMKARNEPYSLEEHQLVQRFHS